MTWIRERIQEGQARGGGMAIDNHNLLTDGLENPGHSQFAPKASQCRADVTRQKKSLDVFTSGLKPFPIDAHAISFLMPSPGEASDESRVYRHAGSSKVLL